MCSDTFILFQGQTNGIVQVYDNKGECNGSKDWQKETRPHHNEIWETSGYISYQPENKIIIWCFKGSKQIFLKTDTLNKACGILSVLLFKKKWNKVYYNRFCRPLPDPLSSLLYPWFTSTSLKQTFQSPLCFQNRRAYLQLFHVFNDFYFLLSKSWLLINYGGY